MKTLSQILVLALLTLGSCTSRLYTGAEYDDLYYLPSDKQVAKSNSPVNEQITEGNLKEKEYFDNKYAADTLVSDEYSDAVDYDNQPNNNVYNNNQGYDYYNEYPYSNRLRMFYGNYFDPYWRDPFYLDYGMGMGMGYGMGYGMDYGMGFGYGGYPYYGYGMGYGYGGLYGDYYGGYPGYYGGYNSGFYGSYFGGGFYGSYMVKIRDHNSSYGRQERPSNLSSRWNSTVGGIGSSRRDPSVSGGTASIGGRTSGVQTISTDQRRVVSSGLNSQQAVNQATKKAGQEQTKALYNGANSSVRKSVTNVRPTYNSVNRTYTPSYNNPRMSTRPSYNNSRVSQGVNSNVTRNSGVTNNSRIYNNSGSVVRSNSSGNSIQRRSESPSGYYIPSSQYRSNSYRSSGSYSVPSRSSIERGSYSSGSSRSSSSYSGSSGSESRGSYSSGSSSSSSSSSSSGSSSGGGSSSRGGGGSSSGRR
jgi:hypothetical protein